MIKEHVERMIVEAHDLGDKIQKLLAFTETEIFKSLTTTKQILLIKQLAYMDGYYTILHERIMMERKS